VKKQRRALDLLSGISPSAAGSRRVADVVAALTPPSPAAGSPAAGPPAHSAPEEHEKLTAGKAALAIVPGVGGGVLGSYLWKKHRVLGFLGGHAVGSVVYPMIRNHGNDRRKALAQLGVEGMGIGGALAWKKHPVLGWLGGVIVGSIASTFVPGTSANEEWKKFREKKGK